MEEAFELFGDGPGFVEGRERAVGSPFHQRGEREAKDVSLVLEVLVESWARLPAWAAMCAIEVREKPRSENTSIAADAIAARFGSSASCSSGAAIRPV